MPHSEEQLAIHIDRIKSDTSWGITLVNGGFISDIAVLKMCLILSDYKSFCANFCK